MDKKPQRPRNQANSFVPVSDNIPGNKIADSENESKDMQKKGFFIRESKYYTIQIQKGGGYDYKELSNFVMKCLINLKNGSNNSQRIIQLQRYSGETTFIEVSSSEMKPEAFETILKTNRCTFLGTNYQFKKIFSKLMDEETEAIVIQQLGWNAEYRLFVFADSIFTSDNTIIEVDQFGIATYDEKNFYLPAYGFANLSNENYSTDRKYRFREGKINFEQWAKLYYQAFGDNAVIGILYTALAAFRDIVFNQVGFFPFLFIHGDWGTGKTQFTARLLELFGEDTVGTPLNNATIVSISRLVTSPVNSMFYGKEYSVETDNIIEDFIINAYDGAGRATGVKSNDNRTKTNQVMRASIFDGNNMPKRVANLSRMIFLSFDNDKFSKEVTSAFDELKDYARSGFGNVLIEILEQRPAMEADFNMIFRNQQKELKNSKLNFPDRIIDHTALLYSAMELFDHKLSFPFDIDKAKEVILENAKALNGILKDNSDMHIFWEAFSYNLKKGLIYEYTTGLSAKTCHFRIKEEESDQKILQLKYENVYPLYVRYCRDNNMRFIDKNSMKMSLTSCKNESFIPNHQKSRGQAYTDKLFGSCYQFVLKEKEVGYEICNQEILV
jgi:hypothetical protein